MSTEERVDPPAKAFSASHLHRVRRAPSAWKVQEFAASSADSNPAAWSSISFAGQQPSESVIVDPGSYSPTIEKATLPNWESGDTIERSDAASKHSRPHFLKRQSRKSASPSVGENGPYLVPLADPSMMPPRTTVPAAETFAADRFCERLEFLPNWEVDQFRWPEVTTRLLYQHEGLFQDLSHSISESILRSQKRLAITGVARGEGRSTLAMTLTRSLARSGSRVLLVDVDLVHPRISQTLAIDEPISWLTDHVEFDSAADYLVGDQDSQVCVLPLLPSRRTNFNKHAYELLDSTLGKVEQHFDAVIMDFGPVAQIDSANFRAQQLAPAALLVHNSSISNVEQYKLAFEKFQSLRFWRFGLIENGAFAF